MKLKKKKTENYIYSPFMVKRKKKKKTKRKMSLQNDGEENEEK